MSVELIIPNWSTSNIIGAFSSTRVGGLSHSPYDSLNVALHVGDNEGTVNRNRDLLREKSGMPTPFWLNQAHSNHIVEFGEASTEADACYTREAGQTCLVMTADCLPVLFCNEAENWVAASHAGWKGLASGVLTNTVKKYQGKSPLKAWVGPAISQINFEVGEEVYDAFCRVDKSNTQFFMKHSESKWLCDLAGIAELQLSSLGLEVYNCGLCTYKDEKRFYSHRRSTKEFGREASTGRIATAIWIND